MSTADSSKDETGITGFEQELEKNLQIQTALNSILRVSLEPISLEETLQRTLELIIRLRWLAFESKGCIFLVEGEPPGLVMKAHVGMPETVLSTCARVAFGTCLCGRAIALDELTFSNCLDGRHETLYPGVEPHGHYCVPIARGERRIGLLNLYVREGHEPSMIERRFLRAAADVLAGVVERDRVEEALWKSEERFELAQRGTDAGIWDWDLRTNALFFSPKRQRILGHEEGEIGQRYEEWESRLHPDDRDRAQATIRDYLQGKITE